MLGKQEAGQPFVDSVVLYLTSHRGLLPAPCAWSPPQAVGKDSFISVAKSFCADLTTPLFSIKPILPAFYLVESLQTFLIC